MLGVLRDATDLKPSTREWRELLFSLVLRYALRVIASCVSEPSGHNTKGGTGPPSYDKSKCLLWKRSIRMGPAAILGWQDVGAFCLRQNCVAWLCSSAHNTIQLFARGDCQNDWSMLLERTRWTQMGKWSFHENDTCQEGGCNEPLLSDVTDVMMSSGGLLVDVLELVFQCWVCGGLSKSVLSLRPRLKSFLQRGVRAMREWMRSKT